LSRFVKSRNFIVHLSFCGFESIANELADFPSSKDCG